MKIIKILLVLSLAALFVPSAHAEDLVQRSGPRTMQGVRPLGMGNAFIASKGTDENAIFYNPAGINDYEKKFHFQFLLPTAEFSYKAINFFASDLSDLADDINAESTNAGKINAFQAFATQNSGRYEEVGVRGNLVTMMHKYVTASLFYSSDAVIALTNPASTTIDIEALTQVGLQVGSAYSFFDGNLQVGGAVKVIERHLVDQTVTQRDVIANATFGDIFSLKEFGLGIGADIGLKGKLPIKNNKTWDNLDPVFAITLQDIGHTRFFFGDNVGRQKQSLSAGFTLNPQLGRFVGLFALDVRELEYRTDFLNKFHAGFELTLPDISKVLRSASVRVGVNQMYITGGFGLDFRYFKINAATYGRDIATRTLQKQSRMFAVQLAAGF